MAAHLECQQQGVPRARGWAQLTETGISVHQETLSKHTRWRLASTCLCVCAHIQIPRSLWDQWLEFSVVTVSGAVRANVVNEHTM